MHTVSFVQMSFSGSVVRLNSHSPRSRIMHKGIIPAHLVYSRHIRLPVRICRMDMDGQMRNQRWSLARGIRVRR